MFYLKKEHWQDFQELIDRKFFDWTKFFSENRKVCNWFEMFESLAPSVHNESRKGAKHLNIFSVICCDGVFFSPLKTRLSLTKLIATCVSLSFDKKLKTLYQKLSLQTFISNFSRTNASKWYEKILLKESVVAKRSIKKVCTAKIVRKSSFRDGISKLFIIW